MSLFNTSPVFALITLTGCLYPTVERTVRVSSEPAGAEVFIDGKATGEYTPCEVDFSWISGSTSLTVRKKGYKPARRMVTRLASFETIRPSTAGVYEGPELFPLWWTIEDIIFPFHIRTGLYPTQMFIRLIPEEEKSP